MSSRFVLTRDFVANELAQIPGWSFATTPAHRALEDRPQSGRGGTWSLVESRVPADREYAGTFWRERVLTGYVLVFGVSDARSPGDADAEAWEGAELVVEQLDGKQVPNYTQSGGYPDGTSGGVIHTGDIEPFPLDEHVFCLLIPVTTRIQWETVQS